VAEELNVNESTRFDRVGPTGIYPASGPTPPGDAPVRGQGELAHPEERRPRHGAVSLPVPRNGLLLGIGRLLYGGYFVYNGVNHFRNRDMMAQYARSKGVPDPEVAVPATGALLLLGGLSLLTGVQPKVGAAAIATFLLGVTPMMHGFWRVEDQAQRGQELVNFTKNAALLGAAALAAAVPQPWPGSLASAMR
jgi:uncharacterized membrane protein YphA (DoxX/SURF4 family)